MQSQQANASNNNDRVELFKCLTSFFDERSSNYHKIIEVFANAIVNPDNIHLLTDEFLNTVQGYGTAYKVFESLLNVPIVSNRKMLEELAELAKGILSSDSKRVIQWIKDHPVPLTLEEKLAIAEQQKAEMEASYEAEISALRRQLLEKTSELEKFATKITSLMCQVDTSKAELTDLRIKLNGSENSCNALRTELESAKRDLDDIHGINTDVIELLFKIKEITAVSGWTPTHPKPLQPTPLHF